MGCPPVRGLSYVQVDKHGITILYHLAYHGVFHAKVSKGGLIYDNRALVSYWNIKMANKMVANILYVLIKMAIWKINACCNVFDLKYLTWEGGKHRCK